MNKDNSTVKFPSDAEFFAELNGVAVDAQGNFYVGDLGNQKIRKMIPE